MKNFLRFFSFLLLLSFLVSCAESGYITSEPTYVEMSRPQRPSPVHMWIEGDWIWEKQTHNYKRNSGYWDLPKVGKIYRQGYWKKDNKGQRWIPGKWHR